MNQIKVNLGCGSQTPDGWINVDYAFGARLVKIPLFRAINRKIGFFQMDWNHCIKIHDLRRPFPFENESVDIVYTSHTLEHFTKSEGSTFLNECYRILKPEGIIRVVVPDLAAIVNRYITGDIKADMLLNDLYVVTDTSGMGFFKRILAKQIQFPHKCMYDTETLLTVLREIGFTVESRAAFESDIDDIEQIERSGGTENAVIVEGRK